VNQPVFDAAVDEIAAASLRSAQGVGRNDPSRGAAQNFLAARLFRGRIPKAVFDLIITVIGRLVPHKGQGVFLEAARLLV
jgi:hypothetical protein